MRFLKHFYLVLMASAFLVACGGGGSDSTSATSNGTDLYAAFDKIGQGMSYDQVKNTVGYAHNAGLQDYGSEQHYAWDAGKGTGSYTLLTVQFDSSGVKGKIVVGPNGSNSKFYN